MLAREASLAVYRTYTILEEPPTSATGVRGGPGSPKNVGTVVAAGELEALGDYVEDRYAAARNREFRGYRVECRRRVGVRWREWDRRPRRTNSGRRWRVVVSMADVSHEQEVKLHACGRRAGGRGDSAAGLS